MNALICLIIWQISHKKDTQTVLSEPQYQNKPKGLAVCNSQTASPFHYLNNFGAEFMNLLAHFAKPHENHGNLSASCSILRVQLAI